MKTRKTDRTQNNGIKRIMKMIDKLSEYGELWENIDRDISDEMDNGDAGTVAGLVADRNEIDAEYNILYLSILNLTRKIKDLNAKKALIEYADKKGNLDDLVDSIE